MPIEEEKAVCPDCRFCQECSKSRCRLCKNDASEVRTSELGIGFTYGEYMEWKSKKLCEEYSLTKDYQSITGE